MPPTRRLQAKCHGVQQLLLRSEPSLRYIGRMRLTGLKGTGRVVQTHSMGIASSDELEPANSTSGIFLALLGYMIWGLLAFIGNRLACGHLP